MQEAEHHGDRWFKEAADQARARAHIDTVAEKLKTATREAGLPIGETGAFPSRALTPDDEGELRLAVTATNGKVVLAFGKAVAWIGLSPHDARQLAKTLGEWADKA